MRISRTPLRISLVGGGTDMPEFYVNHGPGAVVSFAINKYIYVSVNRRFDDGIRVSYSVTENVPTVDLIRHDIVRETLKLTSQKDRLEITSVADIPGVGTGLGSSSAFAVGLIHCLNDKHGPEALSQSAFGIERAWCKKPVGKQDHYAAAYGGMNMFVFQPAQVERHPVTGIPYSEIEKNCLLLYTGITRSSKPILESQGSNLASDKETIETAKRMANLAFGLYDNLQNGDDKIGEYLHANWEYKKRLTGKISSPDLDYIYNEGIKAGAICGKLCGAGGGGFFLFYAPPEKHQDIIQATGLRPVDFKIDTEGSKIIYDG